MTGDAKMKSESAKPLIGIVVCGLSDNRQFVSNPYIQSVRYSGGIPILLPADPLRFHASTIFTAVRWFSLLRRK